MRAVHPNDKQAVYKRKGRFWLAAAVTVIVLLICVGGVFLVNTFYKKGATNFSQCIAAGGALLESYPEQCVLDGRSFTNESQPSIDKEDAYVGLTEAVALERADAVNKTARVVRRDGEVLPVTMDFSPGRLNFYVQDGKVYMVQVEGE